MSAAAHHKKQLLLLREEIRGMPDQREPTAMTSTPILDIGKSGAAQIATLASGALKYGYPGSTLGAQFEVALRIFDSLS